MDEPIVAWVRDLVVVSGPSGAGKSTFLEQLASGRLPRHIRDQLPEGAGTWMQVHAVGHPRWLPPLTEARQTPAAAGLVLHYDLTRRCISTVGDYANDPALRVIHRAESVTVIHIHPDHDRLVRQWVLGKTQFGDPRYLPFWRLLGRVSEFGWPARPWLCALRKRLHGKATRPVRRLLRAIDRRLIAWKVPRSGVLALYLNSPDKVDALYRSWEAFIDAVQSDGKAITQIHIRPAPESKIGSPGRWSIFRPRTEGERSRPESGGPRSARMDVARAPNAPG